MAKKIDQEGMHTVTDEKGSLIAILRRDPESRKHLVYLVQEATCTDIAELLTKDTETQPK